MFRFASPYLLLLLIPVVLGLERVLRRRMAKPATLRYPHLATIKRVAPGHWRWRWRVPHLLRGLALILVVLAVARPQEGRREIEVESEGIDIVLALDVSGSMKAEDFKPHNRLYVAKEVAREFIRQRPQDRLGMVVFAGEAYTQCPLTLDHGILLEFIDQIDFDMMQDGTAIGMAIAAGTNRLRDAPGESRVLILLTDGRNNAGMVDPLTAARAAEAVKVKIHTVGVGKRGDALFPVEDPLLGRRYVRLPSEIDEESLREIARLTGGEYFRATDPEALAGIFEHISAMEKTKVKTTEYTEYTDRAMMLVWPALGLLLLELLLGDVWWRRLP